MGIDSMRVGGGRCPPLLVGGLLLACSILICNWWTLSSENIELVQQIDELNEQIKISQEEKAQCVTLRGNVEKSYQNSEKEVAALHVRLAQQKDIKKKNDELEDSITMCKSELDSLNKLDATRTATLETLRLEKETINTQLDVKRDENEKLQEELVQVKDEISKLKLACSVVPANKPELMQPATGTIINKTQFGPVPESSVRISVAGQRGLKYHGVPILPTDPPGAVRLSPRLSVTMLKVASTTKQQNNETMNQSANQGNGNFQQDPEIPNDSNHGGEGTLEKNDAVSKNKRTEPLESKAPPDRNAGGRGN